MQRGRRGPRPRRRPRCDERARGAPPSWRSCSPRRWPAAAGASGGDQLAQGRHEMTLARAQVVRRARRACKAGDRDRAYAPRAQRLPRPLRVRRDPAAPAQPEPRARHRVHVRRRCATTIRDGASVGRRAREHGRRCARSCSTSTASWPTKGVAAPALAFGFSFSILFREGVEAVLLIAILLGSLAAGQAQRLQAPARARASLGAVVATGVDVGARDARDRHRAASTASCSRRSPRWSRSSVLDRRQLLARRAARAPAPDGVHARAHRGRDRRRHVGGVRRRSASRPSTARASRRCSSTRRSRCSPRASGCGSALGAAAAAAALGGGRLRDPRARHASCRSSRC